MGTYRHVLCVYPYRTELGRRNGFYPPLGLEIIASALQPHADAVEVYDLRRETGGIADFLRPETDLVCISVNWDREPDFVREQVRSVPADKLTIVGGRHATEDPETWLNDCPNIDVLVRGDGEEIVEEIAEGRPLEEIDGISYRLNGRLVHNPVRQCKEAREDVFPDRKLRRYTYWLDQGGMRGRPFDTVASSRGCPFNCTFCSFSQNPWGGKRDWSARSPESVIREIESIDSFIVGFVDDNFTHDMDRVEAICDLIIERGIRKRFMANARVEISRRPEVLRKMEQAGFSMLLLGIESAQDKTLRSMRKGFNTKQLRKHFEVLKKSPMVLFGYFIIGNIGETEEEMLEIAPFAHELGLDVIQLTMLRNERYSCLEQLVEANPGHHIDANGYVYSDRYSYEHLKEIRRRIHKKFYTPRQILKILRKAMRSRVPTLKVFARLPGFLIAEALARRRTLKMRRKRRREAALAEAADSREAAGR